MKHALAFTILFALLGISAFSITSSAAPFTIGFFVSREEPVELSFVDISGRVSWKRALDRPSPSQHRIAIGDTRLSPGVYLVRLS